MHYYVGEKKFYDTVAEALEATRGLVHELTEINGWVEGRFGFNILNQRDGYAVEVIEGRASVGFITYFKD